MPNAIIQSVNSDKGFGFLRLQDDGPDVFFHRSAFRGEFTSLRPGQFVTFVVDNSAEKPRASRVTLADSSVAAGFRPAQQRPSGQSDGFSAGRRSFDSARPREHRRDPERPPACQKGFVTKLRFDGSHGYISADAPGIEIRFEPSVVKGDQPFAALRIGDYVEFAVVPSTVGTKAPEANYVRAIERIIRFPRTNLTRHPRARGKKPSWR